MRGWLRFSRCEVEEAMLDAWPAVSQAAHMSGCLVDARQRKHMQNG